MVSQILKTALLRGVAIPILQIGKQAPGHTASVQEPKYHPRLSRILMLSVSSKRKRAMSWGRGSQGSPKAARFCSLVGEPPWAGLPHSCLWALAVVRVFSLSWICLSPEVLCIGGFGGREPGGGACIQLASLRDV